MKLNLLTKSKLIWTLLMSIAFSWSSFAQGEVTGKVISSDGSEAMPGVSVVVEGSTQGTSTNQDGIYKINAPKNAKLIFSFVGYVGQKIEVNGRNSINVTLVLNESVLNEVVVVLKTQ